MGNTRGARRAAGAQVFRPTGCLMSVFCGGDVAFVDPKPASCFRRRWVGGVDSRNLFLHNSLTLPREVMPS